MGRDPSADFEMALGAFQLFTLPEQKLALERFATLRYTAIEDRFFEAVYSVIEQLKRREG
jgi:hypothetical protein